VREVRNAYKIVVGKLKERDHSEDLGIDAKIPVILSLVFGN
jgi:hypothetical protein